MKSLLDITCQLLQDCGSRCGANPYRDLITVARRCENEGDSFFTITLPSFCQGFERGLDEGFLSPALFPGFRSRRGTRLPRFLGGFVERIFTPSGVLLENPDVDAILCIRQICLVHKRILRPCNKDRLVASTVRFSRIETELRNHVVSRDLIDVFKSVSAIVWSSVLSGISNSYGILRPRHGPGTTREGLRGNKKFLFPSWPLRLEKEFPFSEFGISSILNPDAESLLYQVAMPSARDELPVRVALVPKTLKTPRVIAIEPVCMQYMQQAISDWLKPRIELRGRYTSGHVNFTDQSINANLARRSSVNGSYATIDLSDASDRVSCFLVRDMLRISPDFSRWIFACRSTRATLPSGDVLHLRKFASMGSALCFPIESMVFFIIIVSALIHSAGLTPTPRLVYKYSRRVFVYGDDLIVPTDVAPLICEYLEAFGLKVNSSKSFWTGKFRESCGVDAYDGVDVKPVYCHRDLPTDRADSHGIIAAVSFANQLYEAGFWGTARSVRHEVERLTGELPSISRDSPGVGWVSYSNAQSHNGWDTNLHRLKLRCLVIVPSMHRDPLCGDGALLKCLRLVGTYHRSDHLQRSVRFGNLALKRRWT